MCEILAVKWPEPRPFADIAGWARAMEYYGSGRFGWGVTWLADGAAGPEVGSHLFTGQLADDKDVAGYLADVTSTRFLVHSRRPTLLSTIQLADTQPFVTEDKKLSFCHNGLFRERDAYRPDYAGRLKGGADSEIGFCMLADLAASGAPVPDALAVVAGKLGGNANLGTLDAGGDIALYSNHEANRFFTFRFGDAQVAATELHSPDGSLFRLIFTGATDRAVVDGSVLLLRRRRRRPPRRPPWPAWPRSASASGSRWPSPPARWRRRSRSRGDWRAAMIVADSRKGVRDQRFGSQTILGG